MNNSKGRLRSRQRTRKRKTIIVAKSQALQIEELESFRHEINFLATKVDKVRALWWPRRLCYREMGVAADSV